MTCWKAINVDVSTNGGSSWNTVWTHQGFSNAPHLQTLDLSGTITGHSSVMLRFRFQSSILQYDGDFWQLDNVQLEVFGDSAPPPSLDLPGQAENPIPSNGSSGVGINQALSWLAGPLSESHDVYLGTSSNLAAADKVNQSGSSYQSRHACLITLPITGGSMRSTAMAPPLVLPGASLPHRRPRHPGVEWYPGSYNSAIW